MSIVLKQVIQALSAALFTPTFIKWTIVFGAEILVKNTKNPYDDQFVAELKKNLGM